MRKKKRTKLLFVTNSTELQVLIDHLHQPQEYGPMVRLVAYPWDKRQTVIVHVGHGAEEKSYRLVPGLDYTRVIDMLYPTPIDDVERKRRDMVVEAVRADAEPAKGSAPK